MQCRPSSSDVFPSQVNERCGWDPEIRHAKIKLSPAAMRLPMSVAIAAPIAPRDGARTKMHTMFATQATTSEMLRSPGRPRAGQGDTSERSRRAERHGGEENDGGDDGRLNFLPILLGATVALGHKQ